MEKFQNSEFEYILDGKMGDVFLVNHSVYNVQT